MVAFNSKVYDLAKTLGDSGFGVKDLKSNLGTGDRVSAKVLVDVSTRGPTPDTYGPCISVRIIIIENL